MDVFAISGAGPPFPMLHLYHDDQHDFVGWESLGGTWYDGNFYQPAATSWGPHRLDVFAVGVGAGIHHKWTKDGGATWSGWNDLGGSTERGLAACSWGQGRIDIFHRGDDRSAYHGWLDQPQLGAPTAWSGWHDLGGVTDFALAAASRGPGMLDLFHIGTDRTIYRAEYT